MIVYFEISQRGIFVEMRKYVPVVRLFQRSECQFSLLQPQAPFLSYFYATEDLPKIKITPVIGGIAPELNI